MPRKQAPYSAPPTSRARKRREVTEKPVQGYPGINRRADNHIIGADNKTRLVVESERRPNGSYHIDRVKELENAGIEVQTRIPPK